MQLLRGLALGLLGFFLILCLIYLGLAFTVNNTALNPEFMINEIGKLDIAAASHEALTDFIPTDYSIYIRGIDSSIIESLPWINQQISYIVNGTYDYLLGKTDRLDLSFSTQPFQQSLVKNVTAVFLQSPPADYSILNAAEKQIYLERFQQEIVSFIPSQVSINPDSLGADGVNAILITRTVSSYVKTGYSVLIAVTLVLAFLLVWMIRDVKWILRSMGIIWLISGALSSLVVFGLKSVISGLIPSTGLPEQLHSWLVTVINDFISPWGIFSLSFLIGGLVLFIASFFFRRTQTVVADVLPG